MKNWLILAVVILAFWVFPLPVFGELEGGGCCKVEECASNCVGKPACSYWCVGAGLYCPIINLGHCVWSTANSCPSTDWDCGACGDDGWQQCFCTNSCCHADYKLICCNEELCSGDSGCGAAAAPACDGACSEGVCSPTTTSGCERTLTEPGSPGE